MITLQTPQADHVTLDMSDCQTLLQINLTRRHDGTFFPCLERGDAPLCGETLERLHQMDIVALVFDSEVEARICAGSLSFVMHETIKAGRLSRGEGCVLAFSEGQPSEAFRRLLSVSEGRAVCGDTRIALQDRRAYRTTADIILSCELSHREMREMMMLHERMHKNQFSAADTLLNLLRDDLRDETVLRFLQNGLSQMPGSAAQVLAVSAIDVQEWMEDNFDDEGCEGISIPEIQDGIQTCLGDHKIACSIEALRGVIVGRAGEVAMGNRYAD